MEAVNLTPPDDVISEDDFIASGEVSISGSTLATQVDSASLGPLSRYRIVAPLGKGGMAEVFLAAWEVAPQVHRPVVIKRLYTHFCDDPNLIQMFIDEARLACGFEHENIVKTYEVGIIDGQCCIAMEYLAGQSLQQLLRQSWTQGGVPTDIAVNIVCRALDALSYAHEFTDHRGRPLGIVHRDISPHNIFITNTGQVKLLDFGIAKAKSQESRTATGYVKGKLAYIAPEQAQAKPIDQRADVWSIGVVLWEILVGTRLFRAETDAATLRATLAAPIARPSTMRTEVDPELDRIVMRALRRDPAARYESAAAMRRELEAFASKRGKQTDSAAIACLMQEHFAAEITSQRRQILDLLETNETQSPITMRAPVTPQETKVTTGSALTVDMTHVDGLLAQVSRSQKFLIRALLAALMFVTALATFVFFSVFMRQSRPGVERDAASTTARTQENYKNSAHDGETVPPVGTSKVVDIAGSERRIADAVGGSPAASASVPSAVTKAHAQVAKRYVSPLRAPSSPAPLPSAEMGTLNLDTTPWSVVSVGGRVLGQTPLMGIKLPVGNHILTLRNPDLGVETQYSVAIESGKTLARRVGLQ